MPEEVIVERERPQSDFTMLPNSIFWGKWSRELSWRAVGLYAFLCSLQPGKRLVLSKMRQLKKEGRDAVYTALRELRDAKLLRFENRTGEDGKYAGVAYIVCDPPDMPKSQTEFELEDGTMGGGSDAATRERFANVLQVWNSTVVPSLPGAKPVTSLSNERQRKLKARFRDAWWEANWKAAMERIPSSAFLTGGIKTHKRPGGFVMGFDTFLRANFVSKILEGAYHGDADESAVHEGDLTNGADGNRLVV
jgi:hypothetical protein